MEINVGVTGDIGDIIDKVDGIVCRVSRSLSSKVRAGLSSRRADANLAGLNRVFSYYVPGDIELRSILTSGLTPNMMQCFGQSRPEIGKREAYKINTAAAHMRDERSKAFARTMPLATSQMYLGVVSKLYDRDVDQCLIAEAWDKLTTRNTDEYPFGYNEHLCRTKDSRFPSDDSWILGAETGESAWSGYSSSSPYDSGEGVTYTGLSVSEDSVVFYGLRGGEKVYRQFLCSTKPNSSDRKDWSMESEQAQHVVMAGLLKYWADSEGVINMLTLVKTASAVIGSWPVEANGVVPATSALIENEVRMIGRSVEAAFSASEDLDIAVPFGVLKDLQKSDKKAEQLASEYDLKETKHVTQNCLPSREEMMVRYNDWVAAKDYSLRAAATTVTAVLKREIQQKIRNSSKERGWVKEGKTRQSLAMLRVQASTGNEHTPAGLQSTFEKRSTTVYQGPEEVCFYRPYANVALFVYCGAGADCYQNPNYSVFDTQPAPFLSAQLTLLRWAVNKKYDHLVATAQSLLLQESSNILRIHNLVKSQIIEAATEKDPCRVSDVVAAAEETRYGRPSEVPRATREAVSVMVYWGMNLSPLAVGASCFYTASRMLLQPPSGIAGYLMFDEGIQLAGAPVAVTHDGNNYLISTTHRRGYLLTGTIKKATSLAKAVMGPGTQRNHIEIQAEKTFELLSEEEGVYLINSDFEHETYIICQGKAGYHDIWQAK